MLVGSYFLNYQTPAPQPFAHVDKSNFSIPFVCGATNLGEALRRINEGAAMIRTKGEAGTGNVVEAVRHLKLIKKEIADLKRISPAQMKKWAVEQRVPVELLQKVKKDQRLPVVTFVAGGVATPADAALLMDLGAEGVFVGSGIFKSQDPKRTATAIVQATVHYKDSKKLAEISTGLPQPMAGLEISTLENKMQNRGW
jgi:pyridoxal 5'-phosphate synthase pdxS subunit